MLVASDRWSSAINTQPTCKLFFCIQERKKLKTFFKQNERSFSQIWCFSLKFSLFCCVIWLNFLCFYCIHLWLFAFLAVFVIRKMRVVDCVLSDNRLLTTFWLYDDNNNVHIDVVFVFFLLGFYFETVIRNFFVSNYFVKSVVNSSMCFCVLFGQYLIEIEAKIVVIFEFLR